MAGRTNGVILVVLAACGFEHGRLGATVRDDAVTADDDATMIDAPMQAGVVGIGTSITGSVNYELMGQVAYTVPAGSSLLVVTLSTSYAGTTAVAVSLSGIPLTMHGSVNAPADDGRVEIWRLIDPPAGAGAVQLTVSDQDSAVILGISTFSNTHATAPLGIFNGAMSAQGHPSISVPSAPGQAVIAAVLWNGSYAQLTPGAGQANNWSSVVGGVTGAGSIKVGTATTTLRWDVANDYDDYWALGATAIKPR